MSFQEEMYLIDCPTYESYLDHFIRPADLRYIRNIRFCRALVDLGYRSGSKALYTQEEYEERRAMVLASIKPVKKSTVLFSAGMTSLDPVLMELAAREKPNQQKIISTIIFLTSRQKNGFEMSSYKDYEQSLRRANSAIPGYTDWEAVFQERAMIGPKPGDLCYYTTYRDQVTYNDSENYQVLHDLKYGLIFMHKGDHKKICVDISQEKFRKNCTRQMHYSDKYGHVIFFDHHIRRKV